MLFYPYINPIAFSMGPIHIYWYGLMYLFALLTVWAVSVWRVKGVNTWTRAQVNDLIFFGALGIVLGGRLGYMLFYQFSTLIHSPMILIKVWQGGMSFHGGLLGVLFALWWFARQYQKSYIAVTDFIAPMVPIGLAFGRLGNFINGELWGRPTELAWGMVFRHVDVLPRHPSSLYEFALEGILLGVILACYARRHPPQGALSGAFLLGYGGLRFMVEFTRMPDAQLGFVLFDWMSMGQVLSVPMIALGIGLLVWAYRRT